MFNKYYQIIFMSTLIYGTMTAVSANSWFTSWMGLEINLMSMIPLMLIKINKPLSEASIKYFLVQALASTFLIMSVSINLLYSKSISLESTEILIFLSLMIKAGIPPFHIWFPDVSSKLKWMQCFILFTWQKVAPLLLMASVKMNKIMAASFLAVTAGALGGLNQMNLKSLMAFSSISHSGWIMLTSVISLLTWTVYFLIYYSLSLCIIFSMKKSTIKQISNLPLWKETHLHKYIFSLNLFSLGGLPPFLGFLAKLSVASFLLFLEQSIILLSFMLATLVSLYFYFRITYFFIFKSQTQKKNSLNKPMKTNNTLLILCSSTNILIPLITCLT